MQSKVAPALDIDVGRLKTIEGREKSVEMGERKGEGDEVPGFQWTVFKLFKFALVY